MNLQFLNIHFLEFSPYRFFIDWHWFTISYKIGALNFLS
ncbi:hypothetical protein LEP1GSC081_0871 [Leptospira kirschneri str. H1]|uniref:Uncharacterized protein n=1 Tax=Leptospira kirschneri str. H1 TaxID=1049966 RepID=A0A0E2BB39_9LEPT|nr:hypothetical protein LEP1GSC081_0871 [Leptospira kirschneri str. H1]